MSDSTLEPRAPHGPRLLAALRGTARTRLLVVTPHRDAGPRLARLLAHAGRRVSCEVAAHVRAACARPARLEFDVVVACDDALGTDPAMELEQLCARFPAAAVLVLNAGSTPRLTPATAMRCGAQDVLHGEPLTAERLALAVACGIERQRRLVELRELSLMDPLTGLYNRRGFRTIAEAHLRLLQRNRGQSLLLYADVDRLKEINDLHGHAAGDRALQMCAASLRRALRGSDVVARYGGDEFVALAIDVSEGAALALLPRIGSALNTVARRARLPFALAMSVGTTSFGCGEVDLDEAILRADRVLSDEKRRRASRPAAAPRPSAAAV